eukprot:RCo007182
MIGVDMALSKPAATLGFQYCLVEKPKQQGRQAKLLARTQRVVGMLARRVCFCWPCGQGAEDDSDSEGTPTCGNGLVKSPPVSGGVPSEWCFIVNWSHPYLVLDVVGENKDADAPICLHSLNNQPNQLFRFEKPGGAGCVVCQHSGLVVDVRGGVGYGRPLIQSVRSGGAGQTFQYDPATSTLKLSSGEFQVGLKSASPAADASVVVGTARAREVWPQKWLLRTPQQMPMGVNWMSFVPDSRPLSSLSIPGTHDTMAVVDLSFVSIAQCQERLLLEQLERGVRYVDIRCRHYHDRFPIYHGIISQNADFAEVVQFLVAFLRENPRETVIVSVKDENDAGAEGNTRDFDETFLWYLNKYQCRDQWYLSSATPTLGEVRGKMVLAQRFDSTRVQGIKLQNQEWLDEWECNTEADLARKWEHAQAHLQKAQATLKARADDAPAAERVFFTTFTSAAGNTLTLEGLMGPKGAASFMNPWLRARMIKILRDGTCGIIPMDFEEIDLTMVIAVTNPELGLLS